MIFAATDFCVGVTSGILGTFWRVHKFEDWQAGWRVVGGFRKVGCSLLVAVVKEEIKGNVGSHLLFLKAEQKFAPASLKQRSGGGAWGRGRKAERQKDETCLPGWWVRVCWQISQPAGTSKDRRGALEAQGKRLKILLTLMEGIGRLLDGNKCLLRIF